MPIKPLLSATLTTANAHLLRFPLLVSPKIDGIRGLCWEGSVRSRDWNILPNRVLQGNACLDGLDGEFVAGSPCDPKTMQRSQSMLRKADAQPTEDNPLTYWVFDLCAPEKAKLAFDERLDLAEEEVEWVHGKLLHPHFHIKFVEHTHVINMDELLVMEQEYLALGYEGLMARAPLGLYKNGRSTIREQYLVKVKRFEEDQGKIVGFEELKHNENEDLRSELGYAKRSTQAEGLTPGNTLGALVVEVQTGIFKGKRVKIGSGFTSEQRLQLWSQLNSWREERWPCVLFKHFPYGAKDLPRLPIFKKVLP